MKYLIIGSGGTGAPIGAYLSKIGKDVSFIARGAHLKAMAQNGLTIHSKKHGSFTITPCKAYAKETYNETPDVIFVCVKYYSLPEIADFINQIATPNTLVIPVLNVFGTGSKLQKMCPHCTVVDGCIYIVGMIKEPGIILQPADIFKVYFGYRKGQAHTLEPLAKKVEDALNASGIERHFSSIIEKDALQKFSYVSPIGAAGLYYQAAAGDFMKPGKKQDTFIALMQEVLLLGKAMGITYEEDLIKQNLEILNTLDPSATTSMQRDVMKGGPSEIDGLVHRIVRLGKSYNLSLPTYEMISGFAHEKGIQ